MDTFHTLKNLPSQSTMPAVKNLSKNAEVYSFERAANAKKVLADQSGGK